MKALKKTKYTTILLILLYCIMPIITILTIQHISITDTLSKMENGSFGISQTNYKIKTKNPVNSIIKSCKQQSTNIAVICSSTNIDEKVRYIYFNNIYATLPMERGRFFKPSDFTPNNKVCVIGKNLEKNTQKKNGNLYYSYKGTNYKVLGIIGYEKKTICDSYIYLNMTSEKIDADIFTFDFFKTAFSFKDIATRQSELLSSLKSNGLNPEDFSGGTCFSESIMPKLYSIRWLSMLVVACFLCILLTSIRWINQQKNAVCICRICGARKTDILCNLVFRYICITILSFIISGTYCHIIYPSYFISFFKGFFICIGFMFVVLAISIFKLFKSPLEEVIR